MLLKKATFYIHGTAQFSICPCSYLWSIRSLAPLLYPYRFLQGSLQTIYTRSALEDVQRGEIKNISDLSFIPSKFSNCDCNSFPKVQGLQILIVMNLIAGILSATSVYNYPKNWNASSQFFTSRGTFFLQFTEAKNNRDIVNVLLSTFFCFAIMGIFISSTTIIDRIKEVFYGYSGTFFSIVGVSVCIWQGLVAHKTKFSERTTIYIITIMGVVSSLYLTGGVYLAIASLVAYSIYESAIIPHIYYKSSNCESSLSIGLIFSYILIASNVGAAIGS